MMLTMGDTVRQTLEMTEEDFIAGHRDLAGRWRRWKLLMVAFFPVVLVFMPGIDLRFLALLLPWPMLLVLFKFSPRALGKKSFAQLPPNQRVATFEFSAHDYRAQLAGSDFRQDYSAASSYIDGPSTFVIFSSPQVAQLVPKRAFSTEEAAQIRTWLGAILSIRKEPGPSTKKTVLLWLAVVVSFLAIWQLLGP